ncbi:Imm1 family immunity protein [Bradyrhizobium quebecense]|uniref:Uncharacterized protein n=2 Tax=Bradyrhizobium quebecense TaxID=2748629 RepID=A0ABS3M9L9_9BRAD|nr:Imm1 family immunity protein [Bradyrhizobium quebecense]UGY03580.1 hypothetical protein J4P68_0002025 [Bradyrhizobium quebecense]
MNVSFNAADTVVGSVEELGLALDRFHEEQQFELWLSAPTGRAIAMLRNGEHAWLMHLRFSGDDGFVTKGEDNGGQLVAYRLANGQVDEHPLSWCIDLEQCYKAIAYFFVNDGARPEFVSWQKA